MLSGEIIKAKNITIYTNKDTQKRQNEFLVDWSVKKRVTND